MSTYARHRTTSQIELNRAYARRRFVAVWSHRIRKHRRSIVLNAIALLVMSVIITGVVAALLVG